MARFIDDHHIKLRYHPQFVAVYDQEEPHNNHSGASISSLANGPLIATSSEQTGLPPYDWDIITCQMDGCDIAGKGAICTEVGYKLSSAFRRITEHCDPLSFNHPNGVTQFVDNVQTMERLAANMLSAPHPDLKLRTLVSGPAYGLRECMSAICTQLAKIPLPLLTRTLGMEQHRKVLNQLRTVDDIMKKMNPRSGVESGIEKVKHMF